MNYPPMVKENDEVDRSDRRRERMMIRQDSEAFHWEKIRGEIDKSQQRHDCERADTLRKALHIFEKAGLDGELEHLKEVGHARHHEDEHHHHNHHNCHHSNERLSTKTVLRKQMSTPILSHKTLEKESAKKQNSFRIDHQNSLASSNDKGNREPQEEYNARNHSEETPSAITSAMNFLSPMSEVFEWAAAGITFDYSSTPAPSLVTETTAEQQQQPTTTRAVSPKRNSTGSVKSTSSSTSSGRKDRATLVKFFQEEKPITAARIRINVAALLPPPPPDVVGEDEADENFIEGLLFLAPNKEETILSMIGVERRSTKQKKGSFCGRAA